MFSSFFLPANRAVYETMWKKYGTATNTHSESVIRIAIPLQQ